MARVIDFFTKYQKKRIFFLVGGRGRGWDGGVDGRTA